MPRRRIFLSFIWHSTSTTAVKERDIHNYVKCVTVLLYIYWSAPVKLKRSQQKGCRLLLLLPVVAVADMIWRTTHNAKGSQLNWRHPPIHQYHHQMLEGRLEPPRACVDCCWVESICQRDKANSLVLLQFTSTTHPPTATTLCHNNGTWLPPVTHNHSSLRMLLKKLHGGTCAITN